VKCLAGREVRNAHRGDLCSGSGGFDSTGLAHAVRDTALSAITPRLVFVGWIGGMHGRRGHSLLESWRRAGMLLCRIIIRSVECLQWGLLHLSATVVVEVSRRGAVEGQVTICARGAGRPVGIVVGIHVLILLSHLGYQGSKRLHDSSGFVMPTTYARSQSWHRGRLAKAAPNVTQLGQLNRTFHPAADAARSVSREREGGGVASPRCIDRRMWAMQYSRQERRVAVSVREETFFSLVVVRSSNLKGIVRVVNVVMKSHQGSLLRRRFAVAVVLQNVNAHKQQGGCGEWWEENYSKRVELILVEVKRTSWERTLYLDGS
jgi:hypothetical protein